MRAIRRGVLALAAIVSGLLADAGAHAQSSDANDRPPLVDNKWLLIVPGKISRTPDGLRISVPLRFTHMNLNGPVISVSMIAEAIAWDKTAARCGTDLGNSAVEGLARVRDRKEAWPLKFGETREAVLSIQCSSAARGEFFMLNFELVIYIGKSEDAVRIGAGWPYVPAAD